MCAFILILQVTLILSGFGFTESSELLQCFNDYDTELKCTLTLTEPSNCYENRLTASVFMIPNVRLYTCRFDKTPTCECTMQVNGFVPREIFTVNVLKGDTVWHTENISTETSIKPRRPAITSVIQRPNGDFFLTLNTTYRKTPFSDSLMMELTYGIEGSKNKVTTLLEAGRTTYEIVGRNLQPNSKYILRARMKSGYPPNITFSAYSEPAEFKIPPSLPGILKIVIPIICLILIICTSLIYFWFNRFLKPWWDKIPMPSLSTTFVKQVPRLLSLPNSSVSPISLNSTANHTAKTTCVESSGVRCEERGGNVSVGKGIDSAPLLYSTTGHESADEDGAESLHLELDVNTRSEQAHEFRSEISNRSYSLSNCSSSSFFRQPVASTFPRQDLSVLAPMIQTDLEYSLWNGCTDPGSSKLIHVTPSDHKAEVVLGYQSLDDRGALSSCNDPNLQDPFSTERPHDIPFPIRHCVLIPVEEGYQAFSCVA